MAIPAPRCETFNLDPRRFLMDTADMSAEQLGVYVRLLFRGWLELEYPGIYPAGSLRRISGATDEEWENACGRILSCFRPNGDTLIQKGQRETYDAQTRRITAASTRGRENSNRRRDRQLPTTVEPLLYSGSTTALPPSSLPPSSKRKKTPSACAEGTVLPEGFEDFWSVTPKKVGRPSAIRAYRRAIRDGWTPERLRVGMESYAKSVAGKDRQYILHPTTWINDRKDDETEPSKPNGEIDLDDLWAVAAERKRLREAGLPIPENLKAV